nr:transcriptional regulator TAC1 [Ipomoea batatas]
MSPAGSDISTWKSTSTPPTPPPTRRARIPTTARKTTLVSAGLTNPRAGWTTAHLNYQFNYSLPSNPSYQQEVYYHHTMRYGDFMGANNDLSLRVGPSNVEDDDEDEGRKEESDDDEEETTEVDLELRLGRHKYR